MRYNYVLKFKKAMGDDYMRKLTDARIKELEALGFKRWIKDDYDRLYFNIENTKILHVERYHSGNINWATLNGEPITHADANRLLAVKAYVNVRNGELVIHGSREEARSHIKEEISKLIDLEEKPVKTINSQETRTFLV